MRTQLPWRPENTDMSKCSDKVCYLEISVWRFLGHSVIISVQGLKHILQTSRASAFGFSTLASCTTNAAAGSKWCCPLPFYVPPFMHRHNPCLIRQGQSSKLYRSLEGIRTPQKWSIFATLLTLTWDHCNTECTHEMSPLRSFCRDACIAIAQ